MTAEELKMKHEEYHPNSEYFTNGALQFFGINMEESEVFGPVTIMNENNNPTECWILRELRHNHPTGPTKEEAYFDTKTFEVIRI